MTMTCEHVDNALSAYLEGDLDAGAHGALERHLRECLRCAALVRDIDAIRRDAASLPDLAPSRDLWQGIAERIETPVIAMPAPAEATARRLRWSLAAAAVILVAVSSAVTYTVVRLGTGTAVVAVENQAGTPGEPIRGEPAGVVTPSPRPRTPPGGPLLVRAEPTSPEILYDVEITRLRAVLDERRADLDTATIAVVERSLKTIDQAIADARTALAAAGQSRFLNDQLNRALEKKLTLLRRVALLPLGAS